MTDKTAKASKPTPTPHGLYFVGPRKKSGAPLRFIAGVPARDLTKDETAALDKETKETLVASGLYSERAPLSTEGD